jgi:hypothetical protein
MRRTQLATLLVAAAPLAAQETRFTPTIAAGGTLALENINGPMVITQGTGRTAEVIVTKRVIKGDGSYVKAVMEERGGTVRICTIYTNRDPNRKTCSGENSSSSRRRDNYDEVEMRYEVRVPAGVLVDAESVNGSITATGLEASAALQTVNGPIVFSGTTASHLETVNGKIKATFTKAAWDGTLEVSAVNGGVDLTFPAGFEADLSGETVNGGITSDFPVTIEGKWGPKSFNGKIGRGGRRLSIETVNGGITLKKG